MAKKQQHRSKKLIELEAIIVAYAMSRLDADFLKRLSFKSWKQAFETTGKRFRIPPASMKNLRDEFDPIHPNRRRGWQRPLRANRQRILGEFCDASDEAVMEVVGRLLQRDRQIKEVLTKPLAKARDKVENVAERLRTGRLAEEYFLRNSEQICGFAPGVLIDVRMNACGFDFGVTNQETAIEVKGLKPALSTWLFSPLEKPSG